MALARLLSRGQRGLEAYEVTVEVHLAGGLPAFAITGLPTAAVRESRDRVRAALETLGGYPQKRIIAHLGPADVPKDGGRFDLAIALALFKGEHGRQWADERLEFIGELALSGELRPVTGALPAVLAAREAGRAMILPAANAREAALVADAEVYAAARLEDVIDHLDGRRPLPRVAPRPIEVRRHDAPDLSDVRGQPLAKRALTVAAAGGHHVLLVGPPGSGKSMLAERFRGLLPPLALEEMILVASIASVAGDGSILENGLEPPFRAPHHTASAAALVGGGNRPRPGEISLAHRGVLFLDELPEFSRVALEALREPLEAGVARIARVCDHVEFPAEFQLIAAMNPCPCGHRGDGTDKCSCSPTKLARYQARVSGPLLDRFDLHIEVPRVPFDAIADAAHGARDDAPPEVGEGPAHVRRGEAAAPSRRSRQRATSTGRRAETVATGEHSGTAELLPRIAAARARQLERAACLNARLPDHAVWRDVRLDAEGEALLKRAIDQWQLSMRSYVRVLRVARTIADLAERDEPTAADVAEALQLRCLDRPR